jgi:transcription antitermination factor NusG
LPDGLRADRIGELVMDTQCVDDSEWFAVQVWAGREQCSVNHLRLHGHHVFLPCYCEHRRWSDRIKKIHRALFAGYVFCRQPAATLGAILKTPGVIRIVGDGRHPLPIPAGEIEAIQRIVDARLSAEPWDYVQVGQQVRIDVGPLSGTTGIVLMTRPRRRLVVSIPLLQRSVSVEIDSDWVGVPLDVLVSGASRQVN